MGCIRPLIQKKIAACHFLPLKKKESDASENAMPIFWGIKYRSNKLDAVPNIADPPINKISDNALKISLSVIYTVMPYSE